MKILLILVISSSCSCLLGTRCSLLTTIFSVFWVSFSANWPPLPSPRHREEGGEDEDEADMVDLLRGTTTTATNKTLVAHQTTSTPSYLSREPQSLGEWAASHWRNFWGNKIKLSIISIVNYKDHLEITLKNVKSCYKLIQLTKVLPV